MTTDKPRAAPSKCSRCPSKGKKQNYSPEPMCDACYRAFLLAMPRKEWLLLGKPESDLTSEVEDALNAVPGVVVWQAKKRGGVRAGQVATRVPDLIGYCSPCGRTIAIETKCSHPATCKCESCEGQRAWGLRLMKAGGIYVSDCRSVADAVRAVRELRAA